MEKNSNKTDEFKPLFNIKAASEMSGVESNLIRAYERKGLIRPYRDPKNNYRFFTRNEIDWLSRIKTLINEVGLNIEGIKCILTIEKCWEKRDCPAEVRDSCLAYQEHNFPCWQVKVGPECCEDTDCYKCDFYINARRHYKLFP